jgi:hypothetical protein
MQATYKVVQMVAGQTVVSEPTDILEWAWANDRHTTFPASLLRLRPEIRNEPRIEGLCGPMFDGFDADSPVIRYEDSATYKALSI